MRQLYLGHVLNTSLIFQWVKSFLQNSVSQQKSITCSTVPFAIKAKWCEIGHSFIKQICSLRLNLSWGLNSPLHIAGHNNVCTTHLSWLRSWVQRFPDSNIRFLKSNSRKTMVLTRNKIKWCYSSTTWNERPGCVRVIVSNKVLEFRRNKPNVASALLPERRNDPGLLHSAPISLWGHINMW